MIRWLFPFSALAGGIILLIALLGYGASMLSQTQGLSREDLAALRDEIRPEERGIGHHRVTEWPVENGRNFKEAPNLRQVGELSFLPPIAERLPKTPLVIHPPEQQGPYGGNWAFFVTSPGDLQGMMSMFYETLVRWDPLLQEFLPNIASEWSAEDDAKVFIFHLREGIQWSDGQPFTADDILFWYNHVLGNASLTPAIPQIYSRGGKRMNLEKIDDYTIRFEFEEPHGLFMQWVASSIMTQPMVYPAHYFKEFHPEFADPAALERKTRARGFAFWHQLFLDKAAWHNTDRPTLAAWKISRPPPAAKILFERNPYYWKVDPSGNQLPYIDTLTYQFSALETMTMRFLRGEMGAQSRHVKVQDYPLFMEHRETGNYRVHKWTSTFGSGVIMPNLDHRDPVMRDLIRDRQFRLALSHATNRPEINQAFFFGMGTPMQMSPVSTSSLYREEYATLHTRFDPVEANRLLDGMGLDKRDARGIRLRPDGRPIQLTIEMFDLIADVRVLQLVAEAWTAVGIQTEVKQLARDLFYTRMPGRLHDVAVGGDSNMGTPLIDHMYLVPASLSARHAIAGAVWYMSEGERGAEPPAEMKQVMEIYRRLERTNDPAEQEKLAHEILEINAENVWLIGLVGALPEIVLVHNDFRNVPDHAVVMGSAGVTAPECYAIVNNEQEL